MESTPQYDLVIPLPLSICGHWSCILIILSEALWGRGWLPVLRFCSTCSTVDLDHNLDSKVLQ